MMRSRLVEQTYMIPNQYTFYFYVGISTSPHDTIVYYLFAHGRQYSDAI